MRTLFAELKKSRRRHNTLAAVSISLFVLLWATQTGGSGEGRLEQGYSGLFYAVPVMNAVVMPLGTAVLASRLWDLESKEKNCRILLTLQSRSALFLGKGAIGLLQILLIGLIESVGIPALGKHFGYTEVLDWGQLGCWRCLPSAGSWGQGWQASRRRRSSSGCSGASPAVLPS